MIFTRDDRAGEGKLSSRLVTDAVEVEDGQDLYAYLVDHLSQGGRADYAIADEAQFLVPEQLDQLARVVDDLGIDVYAFGITTSPDVLPVQPVRATADTVPTRPRALVSVGSGSARTGPPPGPPPSPHGRGRCRGPV